MWFIDPLRDVFVPQLCYEQRISELEQQLQQKEHEKEVVSTSLTETPPALEEELKRLKESHGEKEIALQTQIESLQQQLKHKVGRGFSFTFCNEIKAGKFLCCYRNSVREGVFDTVALREQSTSRYMTLETHLGEK